MPEFYRSVDAVVTSSISEVRPVTGHGSRGGRPACDRHAGRPFPAQRPTKAAASWRRSRPKNSRPLPPPRCGTTRTIRRLTSIKCRAIQEAARKFDWQYAIGDWIELIEAARRFRDQPLSASTPGPNRMRAIEAIPSSILMPILSVLAISTTKLLWLGIANMPEQIEEKFLARPRLSVTAGEVRFNLTFITWNQHDRLYYDMVRCLHGSLNDLGFECSITENALVAGAVNVVLGNIVVPARDPARIGFLGGKAVFAVPA